MNESETPINQAPFFARFRNEFIVLLMLVAAYAVSLYAPFWFAPPLFQATIWLYIALIFAWVPVYLLLTRGTKRRRIAVYGVIFGILLSSFLCTTTLPITGAASDWLNNLSCEEQPTSAGRVRYGCTIEAFDGPQYNRTYIIEGPRWSPLLFLIEIRKP
jgi:hypothetical protein